MSSIQRYVVTANNNNNGHNCRRASPALPTAGGKLACDANEVVENTEEPPPSTETCCCLTDTRRKTILGGIATLGIGGSWVASTQLAQATYQPYFHAPYLVVWFCSVWMAATFPLYFASVRTCSRENKPLATTVKECAKVFGEQGLTVRSFFVRAAPFSVLTVAAHYMFVLALSLVPGTDVSALYVSNVSFVYLLSWILLREKFASAGIMSVILGISGIVLMSYSDGFGGSSLLGVALGVGASAGHALYKVLFKWLLGEADSGQVALFMTLLGLCTLLFLWPVGLVLYFTGAEIWGLHALPWQYLCATAGFNFAFIQLINFGAAFTFPIFISVGILVAVPVNAAVDAIVHNKTVSAIKVMAIIIFIMAFLLLLLPDGWEEQVRKVIPCKKKGPPQEELFTSRSLRRIHSCSPSRASNA
ncbi:solute carrier family 35 member F4-like isoform X1 [Branchiostoma floridae x Branchiostoma japonicum]|uniref:EamA domain-containing protein n=1 Tax=Branchiostoma floridae TaxID=7739 RepID=C3ZFA5_BRAFL|eukprot:XP_002593400.1 hypothetical protein BRAFLDRAFT_70831 [Branchiostoma floridae]